MQISPIIYVDPAGLMGILDATFAVSIRNTLSTIARPLIGRGAIVQANKVIGKSLEEFIEKEIVRRIPGAVVSVQRALTGRGGKRIYDLLVKVNDKIVILEVKTKIPTGGSALRRLVGQIKTYKKDGSALILSGRDMSDKEQRLYGKK